MHVLVSGFEYSNNESFAKDYQLIDQSQFMHTGLWTFAILQRRLYYIEDINIYCTVNKALQYLLWYVTLTFYHTIRSRAMHSFGMSSHILANIHFCTTSFTMASTLNVISG